MAPLLDNLKQASRSASSPLFSMLAGQVNAYAGGARHLLPLADFRLQITGEFLRAAGDRVAAQRGIALDDVGSGHHRGDLAIEAGDDRLRGAARRQYAVPLAHLVSRQAGLGDGGYFGRHRRTLRAGHAQSAQSSALYMRQREGESAERHFALSAD